MPKEEWGVKRACPTTGKRFYDLNKRPVVSPYSGEVVDIELPHRKNGAPGPSAAAKKKAAATTADVIDTDDDLLTGDDTADVDVDDDLLEDDEDDTVAFDDLADVAGSDDDDT